MDSNYLYDIFETTEKTEAPDLTIGLAMLREVQELPDGMTEKETREFLARHYAALVAAYRDHDREKFAEIVSLCKEKDEQREAERIGE